MSETQAAQERGIGRVEAFSDGVIAIIITIMVLELKAPAEEGLWRLWSLWHVFVAYILSYIYVGIYWGNHHRLLAHARTVDNALIWSNLVFLFGLSLVPFATAYLGDHRFDRGAAHLYLCTMLLPAIGYVWLQSVVRRTGVQHEAAALYHRRTTRKGLVTVGIYATGFALTFVSPLLGMACATLVALFWVLPESHVDRLFGRA